MKPELEQQLYDEFPDLFADRNKPETRSLMCYGVGVGDGWYNILHRLCEKIIEIDTNKKFRFFQIKEKFGCYDEETEVLTEAGWKYFRDVTQNDKIASLHNHKELIFVQPSDIITYDYKGDMYKLVTRGVDILVTPNHQLYVSRPPKINGNYKPPKYTWLPFELTTYEKYFGKNKCIKKDAEWKGKEITEVIIPKHIYYSAIKKGSDKLRKYERPEQKFSSDIFLSFLGWYVAEGCVDIARSSVAICCNYKNPEEIFTVGSIISKLGLSYSYSNKSGIFSIYNKQLCLYLKEEGGRLALNKKVPSFIKDLSSRQINIFLKSLFAGDGCKQPTSFILTTVSKLLSNNVQELILKAGGHSRIYKSRFPRINEHKDQTIKGKHQVYEINWMQRTIVHQASEKGLSKSSVEKIVQYQGKVYCVTVPDHIIYVRRNGKSYWCGNSLRLYGADGSFEVKEIYDLISQAENESSKTCEYCGTIEDVTSSGRWIKTLCAECRKDNKWRD